MGRKIKCCWSCNEAYWANQRTQLALEMMEGILEAEYEQQQAAARQVEQGSTQDAGADRQGEA